MFEMSITKKAAKIYCMLQQSFPELMLGWNRISVVLNVMFIAVFTMMATGSKALDQSSHRLKTILCLLIFLFWKVCALQLWIYFTLLTVGEAGCHQ